ncbi:DUF4282 domain-containing protein [Erwinia rhapontici]|uniref:DUF4282 domain-containing protein n=1 Tax=Erwinia rhapontici TaxID=55212 RepID=UPI00105D9D19|nr:DUF4282 domain-containing protein [Erwinia rhapontici]TDT01692.1 uncharacterized protein DUF4282 [Erwinia rhapontici]
MLGFDKLITPRIISTLYIITVILFVIAAVISLFNGRVGGAIVSILLAVFCRVFFECIMVTFKNNEYLRRITESLEKRPL